MAYGTVVEARSRARQRGAITLEYGLLLTLFIPLMMFVGEVFRIAMFDLALARATHYGALAAGRSGGQCQYAFQTAFSGDGMARWLFDRNDDGSLEFAFGSADGSAEVGVEFLADNGVLYDGVALDGDMGCGASGAWIAARTTVPVRASFGATTILVRAESWAVNQQ